MPESLQGAEIEGTDTGHKLSGTPRPGTPYPGNEDSNLHSNSDKLENDIVEEGAGLASDAPPSAAPNHTTARGI